MILLSIGLAVLGLTVIYVFGVGLKSLVIELPLINRTLILRKPYKVIPIRKVRAVGYDSRTQDGKHILFLDYDGIMKEIALDDIKCLQSMFGLSTFYVFETRPEKEETHLDIKGKPHKVTMVSWHVVCLDKFNLFQAHTIVRQSGACDWAFKQGAYLDISRAWTLRTKKDYRQKPKYAMSIVPKRHNNYGQSSAHGEFLRRHYGVNVKLDNPDGLNLIWSETYLTPKKRRD